MKNGVTLIGEERERQRGPVFAFTDAHDDAHTNGELVDLAEHFLDEADPANTQEYGRALVKAGAAIAAELDRLTRATGGTVSFSEPDSGIHQRGAGDPDNRDGSQANAQANEPIRAPVGEDDNKTGKLAGGSKPVIREGETAQATAANTPPSDVDEATKVTKRTKAATKRQTATAKAKARSGRHTRTSKK